MKNLFLLIFLCFFSISAFGQVPEEIATTNPGKIVGGAQIIKFTGNINTIISLRNIKESQEASVAWDTINKTLWQYDNKLPIGKRWVRTQVITYTNGAPTYGVKDTAYKLIIDTLNRQPYICNKNGCVAVGGITYTASNGVTLSGTNITLGGLLSQSVIITTSSSNQLKFLGLQTGSSSDYVVLIDPITGAIRRIPFASVGGAANVGDSTKIKLTTTGAGFVKGGVVPHSLDSNDIGKIGLQNISNVDSLTDKQLVVPSVLSFIATNAANKQAFYLTDPNKVGWYYEVSTGTVDSAVVIQTADGKKWKREEANYIVRPEWWGAISGDGTDDYTAIQRAIDYALANNIPKVQFKTGIYLLSQGVTIAKKSGNEYSFVTLSLSGLSEVFDVGSVAGTMLRTTCQDCYGVGIQLGRNCVVENMEINTTTAGINPTMKQIVEWTNAQWTQGTKRDSIYSPNAAIVIDPFHASVLTRSATSGYPNKTSYYTNTAGGGSSLISIRGVKLRNFLVGVLIAPNPTTANGDNISLQNSSISNCRVAWATCETQTRGNIIRNCYFLGGIQKIMSSREYGLQNGTLPSLESNNIAGGAKWVLDQNNTFDDIRVSNNYMESLWAIGRCVGKTATFLNNGFNFYPCVLSSDPARAPLCLEANNAVFQGGSLSYFSNCSYIFNFPFSGSTLFDHVSFEGGIPFNYEANTQVEKVVFKNNCYNVCKGGFFGEGLQAVTTTASLNGLLATPNREFQSSAYNTKYKINNVFSNNYDFIASVPITIDYTNNKAIAVIPTIGRVTIGDQLEDNSYAASITYANEAFNYHHGNFGTVDSVWSGGGVDTVRLISPTGGLVNGTYGVNCIRAAVFITPTFGTVTSGSNVITNVLADGFNSSVLNKSIFGIGIPAGTFITATTSNTITLSRNATATNNNVFLRTCDYESVTRSATVPSVSGAFEPYAKVINIGTDTTVSVWVTPKGGRIGSSYAPTFQSNSAVWLPSGNNVYNTNSGNVGIGITNALTKFQINDNSGGSAGDMQFTANNSASQIVYSSQSQSAVSKVTSATGAFFGATTAGTKTTLGFVGASAGGGTYINFSTNGGATGLHVTHNNGSDLITTLNNGFTGYNNTSPSYRLDVDSKTGSAGNPARFLGLLQGSKNDSVVVANAGVLKQISSKELIGYTDSVSMTATIVAGDILSSSPFTISVTGAAVGDFVDIVAIPDDNDLTKLIISGWVSAANTVSYQIENRRATSVVFTSKIIKARIRK